MGNEIRTYVALVGNLRERDHFEELCLLISEDNINTEFKAVELGREAGPEFIKLRIGTSLYGKAKVATDASLLVFGSFLGGLGNKHSTWAA
jgi:hypothetical protein